MGDLPTQAQTLQWVQAQWPERATLLWRALKLGEEAGEVQGAVTKLYEGRKTFEDVERETAQLVICAMALAESAGFDLQAAIAAEWKARKGAPRELPYRCVVAEGGGQLCQTTCTRLLRGGQHCSDEGKSNGR